MITYVQKETGTKMFTEASLGTEKEKEKQRGKQANCPSIWGGGGSLGKSPVHK